MATVEKTYAKTANATNMTTLATFFDNGAPSNAEIIAALKAAASLLLIQG